MEDQFLKRLTEILEKLSYVPTDEEELRQYYIYYKEDILYLAKLVEENAGYFDIYNLELPE